jgi:hypothetical protein
MNLTCLAKTREHTLHALVRRKTFDCLLHLGLQAGVQLNGNGIQVRPGYQNTGSSANSRPKKIPSDCLLSMSSKDPLLVYSDGGLSNFWFVGRRTTRQPTRPQTHFDQNGAFFHPHRTLQHISYACLLPHRTPNTCQLVDHGCESRVESGRTNAN